MRSHINKSRYYEGVGEITLESDGSYSWRLFEFPFTGNGFDALYRAERSMDSQLMAELYRQAGLTSIDHGNTAGAPWYNDEALKLLRTKWTC